MCSDKPFAVFDGIEEGGFAFRRHWRVFIAAGFGQQTGRVEKIGVKLCQIFRVKQASVLGEREFNAIFRPKLGENILRETRFAVFALDDGVLIPRRLGKKQDFLGSSRGVAAQSRVAGQAKAKSCRARAKDHFTSVHRLSLLSGPRRFK